MSETTIAPIAGVTAGAPTSSRQRLYFADDPTNRKVEATVAAFAFASAVSAKGLSQHPLLTVTCTSTVWASMPPTPTSAPHHSALTGQSQRGAPGKPFQARFHATTSECCEGKTSAGRYKAICR
jgi:hypothetical protein